MLTRVANKFIEAEERLDRGQLLAWILSGLFPPWEATFSPRGGGVTTNPLGYYGLWEPPKMTKQTRVDGVRIDWDRLIIEWSIIAVLGGAHIFLRRQGRDPGD